ncbi:hypothetical protein [Streptomyces brevispora]|uniref:Uncharacterized protein n=1 Tax=Streptomyces brevispora TaxID=887462 RepID=A0ABZ1G633_9ACTN|nr:hypothetical protein [Streptomyces brevispora]WSC14713.1 hypothetical protein OIE64_18970 [Streptomyces brevispora]
MSTDDLAHAGEVIGFPATGTGDTALVRFGPSAFPTLPATLVYSVTINRSLG